MKNPQVVKCCWSGGKDSSCATHLHLTRGDKCIVCCYVPMFTKEIPLILKQHYEFILQTAERFKSMGAEVHIVSGMTYWDYVTHIKQKGDYKGAIIDFYIVQQNSLIMCQEKTESRLEKYMLIY